MSSGPQGAALRHIAVIPDGNRRWARARGLDSKDGHRAGVKNASRAARVCFDAGASHFTFWWGSPANLLKRDADEVAGIVDVLEHWLRNDAHALGESHGAQTRVVGRWRELCPQLHPAVEGLPAIHDATRTLTVLMGYDGRDEIRDAAARLGGGGADADEFGSALWTGDLPSVDLLVRTGGRGHLSAGFMLWQIAEARIRFSDTMWPGLGPDELRDILSDAREQARRYGA